ncbi:putative Histidine kinase [Thiocapsa sp. KS1]|nr:ATP-binding protein [Thiocapsa sp. KS1]CRI65343.1 putative Histidine kinase [Thiocapsa sp. KS1]
MIRSTSATIRLLILPYAGLLLLYVLVVIGAGLWLGHQPPGKAAAAGPLLSLVMVLALAGGAGILIGLTIALVAVGESRRAEGHIQEIYRRASLTEMAAELVHDLRNPLMALRANAKALLVSPEQTAEIVAEIDRDIVALNRKLTGFLDLTRKQDEIFAPTDPGALIADAVRLAAPILRKQGLGILLDIESTLPTVALQAGAIRDALLNLLINAAQSGQRSGSIRVGARAVRQGLRIEVDDRGSGIAAADLPRLFTPFYTTKADGNGLGLAIVRRIVQAHHGRVWLDNRAGGGVRVTLILPLKQPEIPGWWTSRTIDSRT